MEERPPEHAFKDKIVVLARPNGNLEYTFETVIPTAPFLMYDDQPTAFINNPLVPQYLAKTAFSLELLGDCTYTNLSLGKANGKLVLFNDMEIIGVLLMKQPIASDVIQRIVGHELLKLVTKDVFSPLNLSDYFEAIRKNSSDFPVYFKKIELKNKLFKIAMSLIKEKSKEDYERNNKGNHDERKYDKGKRSNL